MTTLGESLPVPAAEAPAAPAKRGFWDRFDGFVERAGERLNPILVKETRQALKSRQFVFTFALLLICGWFWSIMGPLFFVDGVQFGGQGRWVFYGFHIILAFPLLVIVPFGAFRSLAGEWEDGTYELMSISLLTPWQIVLGKLGSAVIQMLVYLSALSPCLAFTYLLQGIDVLTIFWVLSWVLVFSLASTIVALCAATLSRQRHWQVLLSVAIVGGTLLDFFVMAGSLVGAMFDRPWAFLVFDEPMFWLANAAVLSAIVGYAVFFLLVARARLMFPSENRSTALRVAMLAQYAVFTAWLGWVWLFQYSSIRRESPPLMFLIVVGIHWAVMGAFMIGEAPELSPRVKRRLPQSLLGRMCFTWFNPGSGSGYMFALSSLAGAVLLIAAGLAIGWQFPEFSKGWRAADAQRTLAFASAGFCYVAIFLGLARLAMLTLRRFARVTGLLSVLIVIFLVLCGVLIPLTIQETLGGMAYRGYSLLQISNLFWTLEQIGLRSTMTSLTDVLLLFLSLGAGVVIAFNVPSTIRELRQLRVAKPRRVAEEDAELEPEPVREYKSPWDD